MVAQPRRSVAHVSSTRESCRPLLGTHRGAGVQDFFTPEINSDAPTPGSASDWTGVNALTQRYDGYKVQAVLNEIRGYDDSGTQAVGTPAIFGMNFQSISTAQKLPVSDGQNGGYESDGVTPGPVLRGALDYVDHQLAAFGAALAQQHLLRTTAIVLSANTASRLSSRRACVTRAMTNRSSRAKARSALAGFTLPARLLATSIAMLRRQRELAYYMGYRPHRREGHVRCGTLPSPSVIRTPDRGLLLVVPSGRLPKIV